MWRWKRGGADESDVQSKAPLSMMMMLTILAPIGETTSIETASSSLLQQQLVWMMVILNDACERKCIDCDGADSDVLLGLTR